MREGEREGTQLGKERPDPKEVFNGFESFMGYDNEVERPDLKE